MNRLNLLISGLSILVASSAFASEFRCAMGTPFNMMGELKNVKTVTLGSDQYEQHSEADLGPDVRASEILAGVDQLAAQCAKLKDGIFSKKKTKCLAQLAQLKADAPKEYPAHLVLLIANQPPLNEAIAGFIDDKTIAALDKADGSWTYDENLPTVMNAGNMSVAVGIEFHGQGLAGFHRVMGFDFNDKYDLLTTNYVNDSEANSDTDPWMAGMGSYLLTCSRLDSKFVVKAPAEASTDLVKPVSSQAAPDGGSTQTAGNSSQAGTAN